LNLAKEPGSNPVRIDDEEHRAYRSERAVGVWEVVFVVAASERGMVSDRLDSIRRR
jgi:hypothetical protein